MKSVIGAISFISIFINIIVLAQDTIPPSIPQKVIGIGYERHIDIDWWENDESDLAGYRIYRKVNGQYSLFANVAKDVSYKTIYIGSLNKTYIFKLSAFDIAGNESPLSDSIIVSTHENSDEEFLDMTQRATLRYFYEYGHPVSGLARERLGSGETCTIGGSGFGVMAIIVGVEREFISRTHGAKRILKIADFLLNKANRFHGAFPHWINGTNGNVIPFGTYDNGGDLVETSFLIQGLLAARQYFDGEDSTEVSLRAMITQIWESVEWNWYKKDWYSTYLYWHWSPNYNWVMNMRILGPNESMIAYLLAIASPTYSVVPGFFYGGWASSSNYKNGKTFYGIPIYVGWDYGGPLFFQHYSFLGFDPRNKKDKYCNYFENAKNIALINQAYCIANPKGYKGYSHECWGLTASDDPSGYAVHEPYKDNGTISPTAAISSMPYTPRESIDALKYFYRTFGSAIWGEYGFKDAFNETQNWFASSYLAIDQGPIIVMIENYRSGLLWNKFMANPEIQPMLNAIGFVPDSTTDVEDEIPVVSDFRIIGNYPNPFNPNTIIVFNLPSQEKISITIYNQLGEKVKELLNKELPAGENKIAWDGLNENNKQISSGIYFYQISTNKKSIFGKMIFTK